MAARIPSQPTPALLSWARRTAGLPAASAAAKLRVEPAVLAGWERGDDAPSLAQLRRAADVYRRPMATFFLPAAPPIDHPLSDFRGRGPQAGEFSPALTVAIRRARSVREWAIELSDAATTNAVTLPANTDPEAAAAAIRQRLGITRKAQRAWHDEYEALAGWRAAIESVGVLTMQMRRVDIAEARGFSLPASPLPAVVANSKDWPRGRLFTFLHELAHVSLGQSGVCSLDETAQVEARCNAIAGAVLMPAEELRLEAAPHPGGDWGDAELDALSRRFGASREAVLVRLLTLRLASRTDYQRRQEGFARAYEVARQRRPGGRADPPADAVRSCGTTFARLVLEGLSRGRITGADASEYLGIRFKHLPAVQAELAGAAERQA